MECYNDLLSRKSKASVEDLCGNHKFLLPFFEEIFQLSFDDTPDYFWLRFQLMQYFSVSQKTEEKNSLSLGSQMSVTKSTTFAERSDEINTAQSTPAKKSKMYFM
jgi:hypothetical protein